jgi:hypothetical protein
MKCRCTHTSVGNLITLLSHRLWRHDCNKLRDLARSTARETAARRKSSSTGQASSRTHTCWAFLHLPRQNVQGCFPLPCRNNARQLFKLFRRHLLTIYMYTASCQKEGAKCVMAEHSQSKILRDEGSRERPFFTNLRFRIIVDHLQVRISELGSVQQLCIAARLRVIGQPARYISSYICVGQACHL